MPLRGGSCFSGAARNKNKTKGRGGHQEDIGKKIRDVMPVFSARGSSACGAGKNPHGQEKNRPGRATDPFVAADRPLGGSGRPVSWTCNGLCMQNLRYAADRLWSNGLAVHFGRCEPRTDGFESRKKHARGWKKPAGDGRSSQRLGKNLQDNWHDPDFCPQHPLAH